MSSSKPGNKRSKKRTYTKVSNDIERDIRSLPIDCTSPLSIVQSFVGVMKELGLEKRGVPRSFTRREIVAMLRTTRELVREFQSVVKKRLPIDHAQTSAQAVCAGTLIALAAYEASNIPPKVTGEEGEVDLNPDAVLF